MLWLLVITVFIGEATITAGWWTAEIGRQPWVVYNVLLTAERGIAGPRPARRRSCRWACSSRCTRCCSSCSCTSSTARSRPGPEELEDVETVAVGNLPDTFRDIFSRPRRAADLGEEP